ncbi:hemagglutinin repeat-containing protein, partial [Achromobacter xylosoxidans]
VGSQGVGFTLNVAASAARGKADGKDTSWTSSTVTAGKVLGLQSGGDTSLIGAIGQADRIVASVGNNLRIETLQDISTYASKQQSAGIAGSLCYGYCTSTISGNVSQGQMKSNFKSASEQAGLKAGDGGFIVDVKNNTTLIGGLIASSDKAVAEGLNTLATGTLVTENLKNSASYKASQVGISGGYGWGGSGGKDGGKDAGLGTDAKGNVAGGSKAQPGTSVPQTSGGLGMGTPVVAAASGRDSSTTYSAISGGTVVIRDEVAQQNLTGMTAAETIASLNRDTSSDTLNALKPIFDKEKIEAGFEIVAESQRQVGQFLTNRAKEIDSAKRRAEDPSLPYAERVQAAKEYADLESKWGAQGRYSQWGTIILGAASGNVMGGTGQFVQAATVNYLQTLGAAQIKELSRELGGEGSVGHAALHAVLGCAGAVAQGASCGAGGVGALSGVVLSKLLESVESDEARGLSTEEMQARVNLISSIVAGVAGAIDPSAATAAQVAARIELENNSFYTNRKQVAQMKAELIDDLLKRCGSDPQCLQAGFEKADRMASAYDVTLTLRHYPQLTKEKADALAQAALDLAPGVSNASALYELMAGKTATGEEANRFFSAIGLVPVVGGMLKKGGQALHVFADAGKAIDIGKVGGASKAVGGSGTRFIDGVTVVDQKSGKIFQGTVDLGPTLDRIKSGGKFPHKNDGSIFRNNGLDLPQKPAGYYTEYVHPTPGISGPGPQRIVVGKGGEMYYTADHYKTFIPIAK